VALPSIFCLETSTGEHDHRLNAYTHVFYMPIIFLYYYHTYLQCSAKKRRAFPNIVWVGQHFAVNRWEKTVYKISRAFSVWDIMSLLFSYIYTACSRYMHIFYGYTCLTSNDVRNTGGLKQCMHVICSHADRDAIHHASHHIHAWNFSHAAFHIA